MSDHHDHEHNEAATVGVGRVPIYCAIYPCPGCTESIRIRTDKLRNIPDERKQYWVNYPCPLCNTVIPVIRCNNCKNVIEKHLTGKFKRVTNTLDSYQASGHCSHCKLRTEPWRKGANRGVFCATSQCAMTHKFDPANLAIRCGKTREGKPLCFGNFCVVHESYHSTKHRNEYCRFAGSVEEMLAYLQGCGARLESPPVKGMDAVATGTYEPSGSLRSVVIGLDHDLVDDGGSVSSVPSESISAMTHSTMMGSPFAIGFGGSNGSLGPVDDYVGGITPPSRSGILDSIDSVDSPMSATDFVSATYHLGESGDDNGTGEGDVFAGVSTLEPSRGSFLTPPLCPMVEPVPNRQDCPYRSADPYNLIYGGNGLIYGGNGLI